MNVNPLKMKFYSKTLLEAQKAIFKPHPALALLMAFALLLVSQAAVGILSIIIGTILRGTSFFSDLVTTGVTGLDWWQNVLLIIVTLTYVFYSKWVEKRSPRSLGFSRKGIFSQYMQGAFLGWLMISLSLGLCLLLGSMEYQGLLMNASVVVIALWFLGFIIQAMSEEVMCRGFLLVTLSNRMPVFWAIIISSSFFSLIHLLNPEVSWLAILNLTLYGIFAAVYFLRTDNIWAVSAHHALWNWLQGNVYGIEVSGQQVSAVVWKFTPTETGEIISGGRFGLEGGLAVTLVLIISTLVLCFWKKSPAGKKE